MTEQMELTSAEPSEVMTADVAREWLAEIENSPSGTGFYPAEWVRAEVERITGKPLDVSYIGAERVSLLRTIAQRVVEQAVRGEQR